LDFSIFSDWTDSPKPIPEHANFFFVTDKAVASSVPDVTSAAISTVAASGISIPDEAKIEPIIKAFERSVPYNGQASLPELLCAGWRFLRSNDGLGGDLDSKKFDTLNEILLKSVEISEFIRLTS
jgi:hypothetical protein